MDSDRAAAGRLVVCPTPLGNLADITLRTVQALRSADIIACEDTRRTRILLEHHRLLSGRPRILSIHQHNERERSAQLLDSMRAGALVALVSDAGTPLISDPGFILMRETIDAGLSVEVLPGPSAPIVALVASGLPCDQFRFVGFLPRSRAAIEQALSSSEETLVAFESAKRLPSTLALLAGISPDRQIAVCRELTKIHEEVLRGSAIELAARLPSATHLRGEIVLVVAGAEPSAGDSREAVRAVEALAQAGAKPRVAARVVADLSGLSANELYRLAAGKNAAGR